MAETVLLVIAIVTTVLFIIKFVLSLFAMDTDIDVDFDTDFDTDIDGGDMDSGDAGLTLFTIDGILVFLMIFTWSTLAILSLNIVPTVVSYIIGIVLGVLIMVVYAFIIKKIRQLETEQVKDVYPNVGDTGVIYLTVKKEHKGQGKFSLNGKQVILDVVCNEDSIATGAYVRVIEVDGKKITVESIKS